MYRAPSRKSSQLHGKAELEPHRYGPVDIAGSGSTIVGNVIYNNLPVRSNTASSLDAVPVSGSQNVHWTITRPTNSYFTGRGELVDEIAQTIQHALKENPPLEQCRLVVTGMGGQGKSEICLQVANRVRSWFWGVFWVDVATVTSAESGFLAIASRLKLIANSNDQGVSIDEVIQVLANLQKPWLLVLDNADDSRVDYQSYFPTGSTGVIIITSRNGECSQYSTRKSIALDGLPVSDARDLLLTAAKIPPSKYEAHKQDAEAISSFLLQGHPLATIQAGAYILRGHCSLAEYRNVFHRQRKRLLKFRFDQARSRYGDVYATFEVSAEIIQSLDTDEASDALQLLSIFSMLDSSRLPLPLFETIWKAGRDILDRDEEIEDWSWGVKWHVDQLPPLFEGDGEEFDSFRLLEAIRLLESYSLIVVDVEDDIRHVSMHPLTHAWAKERQEPKAQRQSWLTTACIVAVSTAQSSYWIRRQQGLRSHLLALLRTNASLFSGLERTKMNVRILYLCADLLDDLRLDNELYDLMEQIFKWLKLDPMVVTEEWLSLYYLSGMNKRNYGQTAESVSLLEQIVEIRKTMDNDNFLPTLLSAQVMLARAYAMENLSTQAISLLQEVVKTREETLDEDDSELLGAQHELGSAYLQDSQVSEAIALLEHVVKIRKECLAEDDNNLLASTHELARGYLINDQVDEALELLEQVVKTREQVLAEDHRDRLVSQHVLAMAYNDHGEPEKAIPILEEVVRNEREVLVSYHRDRLRSMYRLAVAYIDTNQKEKAIPLLEEEIEIRKGRWSDDDSELLTSQDQLAYVYNNLNHTEKALPILEEVVEVRRRISAKDDAKLLTSLHELGFAYRAEGRTKEALEVMEEVVTMRKTILEETSISLLISEFVLATAHRDNDEKEKALEILKHVSEVESGVLEAESASRMVTQHELGAMYCATEQREIGISILEEVVEIRKRTLDADDGDLISSQNELAFAYKNIGQTEKAVAIWDEIVKVKEGVCSEDDSSLLAAQHRLGLGYESNGQIPEAMAMLEKVVEIEARTLDEKDNSRLISRYELARMCKENDQLDRGLEMIKQIVKIRDETLAEDHESRLTSQELLALAYWEKDERDIALGLLQHIVDVHKRTSKKGDADLERTGDRLKRWKRELGLPDDISTDEEDGKVNQADGAPTEDVQAEPEQGEEQSEDPSTEPKGESDKAQNEVQSVAASDDFEIINSSQVDEDTKVKE